MVSSCDTCIHFISIQKHGFILLNSTWKANLLYLTLPYPLYYTIHVHLYDVPVDHSRFTFEMTYTSVTQYLILLSSINQSQTGFYHVHAWLNLELLSNVTFNDPDGMIISVDIVCVVDYDSLCYLCHSTLVAVLHMTSNPFSVPFNYNEKMKVAICFSRSKEMIQFDEYGHWACRIYGNI